MAINPPLSASPTMALAFLLLGSVSYSTQAACTREGALNRMTALNQFGMKLQAALPDPLKDPTGYEANYRQVIDFNSRLGAVGETLAAKKYDEACASYDALAKDYHVDLAAQKVRSITAVEAEAKHSPAGGCDLAESARRSAWLTESFETFANANHLGREDWQRFSKETEQIGLLMQQDPNQACARIDTVAADYGFKR